MVRGGYCSLSCLNCRVKKRKCDGEEICANCKRLGLECKRAAKDRRTVRLTTIEIADLQANSARLLRLISEIGDVAYEEDALNKIRHVLQTAQSSSAYPNGLLEKTTKRMPVSIGASGGGEYSVFGPTSAFYNLVDMTSGPQTEGQKDSGQDVSPELRACVASFFRWLYPDITVFIHRESFLNEFLNAGAIQKYCLRELVWAIAALGAKCSDIAEQRELAQSFYESARAAIFAKKVCEPQINTLQALLCLSLYELGDGNASASWMLSGMAMRMGYDLGFQLNPSDWSIAEGEMSAQQSVIAKTDIMIRSRIYWGCYILDHFISLIMGRPVTVRKTEASIPSSEMLPNAKNIDEYVFNALDPTAATNLDAALTIEPLCSLGECVGALLKDIFSAYTSDEGASYLNKIKVAAYNQRLADWRRKLPLALRWTRSSFSRHLYNPTVMNYRLFFYIVLICLNRPFIGADTDDFPGQSPLKVCSDGISELSVVLAKFNELGFSLSILVVYSSILGLSVLLVQAQNNAVSADMLEQMKTYYKTVSVASCQWKLAARSIIFFRNKATSFGDQAVSSIFEEEQAPQGNLGQLNLDQVLGLGEDMFLWGNQDNLLTNFFDFFEH